MGVLPRPGKASGGAEEVKNRTFQPSNLPTLSFRLILRRGKLEGPLLGGLPRANLPTFQLPGVDPENKLEGWKVYPGKAQKGPSNRFDHVLKAKVQVGRLEGGLSGPWSPPPGHTCKLHVCALRRGAYVQLTAPAPSPLLFLVFIKPQTTV